QESKQSPVTVTQNIPNPIEYTDTVTLTCDVKGTVESRLWFKDERALHSNDRITISQDNATLTIISVTRNDGGTYRGNKEAVLASVADGPDTPELTITGTHSAELGDSLTLSCSAQSNPEAQYQWIFNGTVLNDRITISQDNATLTIISVTRNDGGTYRCEAKNSFSSVSGSYTLNGPDTPELTITGTHSAELGDSLTLSCSAQSNPEAQYKWIFNGTVLSHTTPQLTIDQISPTDRGSYTWSPVAQQLELSPRKREELGSIPGRVRVKH
uniref:Ig-like domain-containing protein n=1 Tax=Callorhinchus milii TaxID=7868 RepID=A0A4W3GBT1_CALMI